MTDDVLADDVGLRRILVAELGWERLRRENRTRERLARKAAGKRPCRTCGRLIPGEVSGVSTMVECGGGRSERVDYTPNGRFGYQGICTLRCALRWADKHAPGSR